ncbi:hypothetical protein E2C06_22885 [Dankookia rubra]|uniref:Uncharacterized protein n=1 Tax=Dankookia rubra TaxID=1442381 RepID=A0A4R5QD40_9PROT|nr:hypothetical protein [Dankookia rubra]TDH60267.1 hypothetical protein E2C06_22885 [Dankookia rubra]
MAAAPSSGVAALRNRPATSIGPAFLALALLLALESAGGAAILRLAGEAGPALLAALGSLAAGIRFGWTLRPGAEPLISRYSRFDAAGLPDPDGHYTRRLTAAWAVLLGGFALTFLAAALGLFPAAPLWLLQPALCTALFFGEHVLRRCCFPELGRVTPLRTLQAIYRCHRQVRHAA